jgi:colanic acid biosynthesis glycosyl transferase WcaI
MRHLALNQVRRGRLLINCVNYTPEILGTAPYTRDLAEWFAAEGWDVRVVTTYPYYPAWRRRAGDPRLAWRRESAGGVGVVRCPAWIPARPTGARRLAHYASFAASSLPASLVHAAWRPDLALVVAPTLASAPGALLTAALAGRGCRTWLHVQDYEVDVALGLGLLPPAARSSLKRLEGALLRSFDVVSSITEPMLEVARGLGVPDARLLLLPNWANLALVRPLDRPSSFRTTLCIPPERRVVLYTGNLGRKQGVRLIAEAAARCTGFGGREPPLFVVAGAGAGDAELTAAAADAGLGPDRLLRLPLQPDELFNELLNLADVHLVVQDPGVSDRVMPSKLTNMLASGRPVVATSYGGTALSTLIVRENVGEVVAPGAPDELASTLERLLADDEGRTRMGRTARRYAEAHLDRNAILTGALTSLGI